MHRFFNSGIHKPQINIQPGELYVTSKNECLFTILGSCVSVCLLDPHHGIGGLNHYLLPCPTQGICENPQKGRYAMAAMDLLMNQMQEMGANLKQSISWVFGGASTNPDSTPILCVAPQNTQFAVAYLKDHTIPIHGIDMGGSWSRRVMFDVGAGQIDIERIRHTAGSPPLPDTSTSSEANKIHINCFKNKDLFTDDR